MVGDVIDRLVVAVGFDVNRSSYRAALGAYTDVASAAAAATAAAVALAVAQAKVDDQNIKTARALQMTAEDYTRLSFVFDRNGVSAGQMQVAVRTLQRQLLNASRGSAEAEEAFAALGVASTNADGSLRTAADALPDIVEALRTIPDRGRAAALSLVLFGRSGDQMGTLIQSGAAGIAELTARADELGITLSTKAGEAAERLVDAVTDLQGVSSGFRRMLANELIPPVTRLVEGLTDWAVANREIIGTRIEQWGRIFGSVLDALQTDAGQAAAAVVALGAALGGAQAVSDLPGVGKFASGVGRMGMSAIRIGGPMLLLAAAIDEISVAAEGGETAVGALVGPGARDEWEAFAKAAVKASGEVGSAASVTAAQGVTALADAFTAAKNSLEALFGVDIPVSWQSFFTTLEGIASSIGEGASTVSAGASLQRGTFGRLAFGNLLENLGFEEAGRSIRERAMASDLAQTRAQSETIQRQIIASEWAAQMATAVRQPTADEARVSVNVNVDAGMTRQQQADLIADETRRAYLGADDALDGL